MESAVVLISDGPRSRMNSLVKASIDGEIITPDSMIPVYGTTHPLNAVMGARIECHVRAGSTIQEILLEALSERPGWHLRRDLIVTIGDENGSIEIPEENWHKVRVKEGTTVTFRPRLQNGNVLRTVLSAVVAVVAIVLAAPTGGLSLALAGTIGVSASVAGALIAGGIMLAGTVLLNALLPIAPTNNNVNSTALNSIQGAQNQANPFGPVPVVLGTNLQSPYYGASGYTEILGDDQYLRLVFCLGYGPLEFDTFKIGNTPLTTFANYQIETRNGYPGDAPLSLYPGSVVETPLSIDLVASPGFNVQRTALETDQISVDITAPQGTYGVDGQGGIMPWQVIITMQYRLVGATNWTNFGPIIFNTDQSPQRAGAIVSVPRGQYDVQVMTNDVRVSPGHIFNQVTWTALRSFHNSYPIAFNKPLALVALRIKATGQLSGVIQNFNCMCRSLVTAFNGASWVANTASQNPADLFRWVLQGPANARPRTDAQIDIANLQSWWSYCNANGFAFNQVINTVGSVYNKLCDIAAAGRAVPTFTNGLWGVDWDRPNDSIVQHFTPRNSWGFQLQHPYVQQPDGWRVSFINEQNGYTQDERIVYDDGFNSSNATLFEGIQFPGVTNPDLIWRHGRFQIAQARLRPEKITISVGWEHLVCTRGDRVKLTHDAILIGLAFGRVKSVVGQVVTFDEILTIVPVNTYGIEFRVPDDIRTFERAVDPTTASGEYTSLTLVGDLSLVTTGTLFAFGTTQQESAIYRVQGISHQKDLIATLTLVDDAPAISQADQGTIPAYNPNVTIPTDPFTLPPQDFRYLLAVDGIGSSVRAVTILSWVANRQGKISASELQVASGALGTWQPLAVLPYPQFSLSVPLPSPGIWSYRVRFQFSDNIVSNWVTLSNLTLLGLTAAPNDVQNIRGAAYVDGTSSIAWDEVSDYRPIRYAVRKGDSWESALELGTVAHPPFAAHGNGTYWVKAYAGPDTQRAYSVNAVDVLISGAALVTNVIAIRDEAANGWTGVFTGAVAKSGLEIRTGGAGDILSDANFLGTPDILNLGGQGNGTYEIDSSRYINAGRVTACNVVVTWKGTSTTISDNMLGNSDLLNDPDFLASGSTSSVLVYPEIAVSQTPNIGNIFSFDPVTDPANNMFVPADIFSASGSFGPWLKYEPGSYVGQLFRARLNLQTTDPQVEAIGLQFALSVDVPDRLDTWAIVSGTGTSLNQVTVPSTGLALTFASTGKTSAEAFNGGPGTDTVPLIQITNTDALAFDFEVNSLTLAGCTIIPRIAGTPTTAPKTNISIQGW